MRRRTSLYWVLMAISCATVASGLIQVMAPSFILTHIHAQTTPTSNYFFRIIGMFMVLFGAMLIHALPSLRPQPVPIFWAAAQKFGAFFAVSIAVLHHVFSPLALAIAVFDLICGFLILNFWRQMSRSPF